MTLLDLQRRIMEAGRIRIGETRTSDNGKTYPAKLETFRLTSPDRQRIDQAAELFGGKVTEWQAPAGKQWQVTTDASTINVIVPPADLAFSQHYEVWSAGGCQRRCDGIFEQISDGPCLCDPEDRECAIHTRLSLMIRDLPGLGLWRLDTSGYYAATELAGALQVIAAAAGRGVLLPARLLLVQRSVIRRGADGKPQTRRFAVPVLDIEVTPGQLLGGMVETLSLIQLEAPKEEHPALLTPVPDSVPERPVSSVAEQAAMVDIAPTPKPRANAAQPIPATGLEPRTAAEASQVDPDEPWADLYALLNKDLSEQTTMPVLESYVRTLYRLMDAVGVWPIKGDPDPLHQALRKYGKVAHVSELRKDALLEFCRQSWVGAKAAVEKLLIDPVEVK